MDPDTPYQRLGVGLVAVHAEAPVALAAAVPPEWIDTIPGAEAWALFVVLSMAHSPPMMITDCLGNRRMLLSGEEQATAPGKILARVWHAIFACRENVDQRSLQSMFTWMPAHTTAATFSTRCRSDGRRLTAIDWRANAMADALAKKAAQSTRVPVAVRRQFQQMIAAQRYGAAVAGAACRAADSYVTTSYAHDGSLVTTVYRDSIGRPNAAQVARLEAVHDEQENRQPNGQPCRAFPGIQGSKPADEAQIDWQKVSDQFDAAVVVLGQDSSDGEARAGERGGRSSKNTDLKRRAGASTRRATTAAKARETARQASALAHRLKQVTDDCAAERRRGDPGVRDKVRYLLEAATLQGTDDEACVSAPPGTPGTAPPATAPTVAATSEALPSSQGGPDTGCGHSGCASCADALDMFQGGAGNLASSSCATFCGNGSSSSVRPHDNSTRTSDGGGDVRSAASSEAGLHENQSRSCGARRGSSSCMRASSWRGSRHPGERSLLTYRWDPGGRFRAGVDAIAKLLGRR